jgi:hypothetical protein
MHILVNLCHGHKKGIERNEEGKRYTANLDATSKQIEDFKKPLIILDEK